MKNMRFKEQLPMSFRDGDRLKIRWFSVRRLGPGPLGGGPAVRNMRFREQPPMSSRVRVEVRWFSVGHLGSGPFRGGQP